MTAPSFASPKAIARFRLLQLHLEKDIPLARVAAEGGIAERTLRRWLAAWRAEGIAGLERDGAAMPGSQRLAPEIEALVRSMATRRPRPTAATIHRKVQAEAKARGLAGASYSVVAGIVRGIEPARIAVTTDAAAYRDRHELVHRRDADAPNEMWQALAAVIRLTRGNLRLVERLLAQMRRIMDLNTAKGVTLEVVEAARDRLVIGPGD